MGDGAGPVDASPRKVIQVLRGCCHAPGFRGPISRGRRTSGESLDDGPEESMIAVKRTAFARHCPEAFFPHGDPDQPRRGDILLDLFAQAGSWPVLCGPSRIPILHRPGL